MSFKSYFKDWVNVIDKVELNKVVSSINECYKNKECTPEYKDIFKVFTITPYYNLSQVWLFQDPYPQKGVATGIAIGNHKNTTVLSPSLEVIKESAINFEIPHNCINFDNSLEDWCKQGILLLNSALTTENNKTGSHMNIWYPFIKSLIKNLSNNNTCLIFVLWGSSAKMFEPYIDKRFHRVIKVNHPSWYARTNSILPPSLFYTLSSLNERFYGNKINWYKEY